jgi:hypothetical protein
MNEAEMGVYKDVLREELEVKRGFARQQETFQNSRTYTEGLREDYSRLYISRIIKSDDLQAGCLVSSVQPFPSCSLSILNFSTKWRNL